MLNIEDIRKVARLKGIRNMGFAEKDYFQELLLLAVSRMHPHLVFKGGTCLYKLHGLDRFSEDLDFSGSLDERGLRSMSDFLSDFGYRNDLDHRRMESGLLTTFKIQGFLYNGNPLTLSRVQVDLSEKDVVEEGAEWITLHSHYTDIPSFRMPAMTMEEILAEKVRAMMMRGRARDLYDIDFMLGKGVSPDPDLISKKLAVYDLEFSGKLLEQKISAMERGWKMELNPLIDHLPEFRTVADRVQNGLTRSPRNEV